MNDRTLRFPSDSPQRYPRTFSVTFNPLFGRPTVRDIFVEDASKRMNTGKVKKLKYKHPNRPMNTAIELVNEEVMDDFRTNVAKSKLRTSQWQLFFTTVSTSFIPLESSTKRKQVHQLWLPLSAVLIGRLCFLRGFFPDFADVFCPHATSTAVETDETPQITLSITQPAPAHDIPLAPQQALQRTIEQLRDRYSTENGVVWRNGVTDVEFPCADIMLKVWANCILENDYRASLDSPPVLPMFRSFRSSCKKVKVARLAKRRWGRDQN
ncbi:hypothetical protein DFJ73DRAFT_792613 [Zopfochytrium polystomum]|nr:hypothetical protein DFJ73DRAFT_792613 [Zopfochytrium polystomum]